MPRPASLLLALSLLAAAGPAAPQSPMQAPESKVPPRESGLNLKLDEADLRSLSRNSSALRDPPDPGKGAPDASGLPSLGGDARTFERAPTTSGEPTRGGPYPQDTSREYGR
jgi:hypothetical protein